MEISNLYNALSIASTQEKAAPVGDPLRVAVTKTSEQGKEAQGAAPNLMSFSTNENSIWFNKRNYGVVVFKNVFGLSTGSSNEEIKTALGGNTYGDILQMVNRGILFLNINNKALQHVMIRIENKGSSEGDYLHIRAFSDTSDTAYIKIHHYNGVFNVPQDPIRTNIVFRSDIVDNLTSTDTTKVLSAAQGKKLNDEKLAKTDVVNGLMSDATDKPLSAAQGKYLNSLLMDNKLLINYGDAQNSTDDTTIQSYMGTDSTTFYNRLMRGATLIDVSTDNWIINIQEVSTSKVVLAGVRFQSYSLYANVITITISGGKFTNLVTSVANRYMPSVINNLTSSDTANALSAAQGKILNDKISALGSVYRIKGSKTNISDVLALTDAKVGDVWNVANAFTFGGKSYPASTNVVCITATSSSDHDENNWDPIGGTVDLSPYAKKDEIVNDLTSTDTDKPLSAAMGKKLNDEKLSKTEAGTTYIPKSSIADNLETSDSSKVLSAKQGLALRTLIEEAKNTVGVYKLLKILEEGTLATSEEINAVLGTYNTFNTEVNKPSVIIGRVKDSDEVIYTTALSVRASTVNNTIYMYSLLPSNTEVHIKATYSESNWTSCVTEFADSDTRVIIE